MISVEAARALIREKVQRLEPVEMLLRKALDRVLRADVIASEDAPAFDRSAMDGYAIDAADGAERFRVVAEIQCGAAAENVAIQLGECARIFTGAAIPAGASQVIMQEDVTRDGEFIVVTRRTSATHIRRRGEDARAGAVLLKAGTRLGPAEGALLAQFGSVVPCVSPIVRAAHFTTGNELVDPETTPAAGQIRDSNSTLIAGLLARAGAALTRQERCGDSLEALVEAVKSAGELWDLLLISGGASVGDYDFGARALEALGFQIHFSRINLRPGKPLIFATRGGLVAFVIPGNPASHLVTFHLAIACAIQQMEDSAQSWPLARVALGADLHAAEEAREVWWPAHVSLRDGAFMAQPLAWQSSGDLVGIASANALLRVPPHAPARAAGENIECLLLDLRA